MTTRRDDAEPTRAEVIAHAARYPLPQPNYDEDFDDGEPLPPRGGAWLFLGFSTSNQLCGDLFELVARPEGVRVYWLTSGAYHGEWWLSEHGSMHKHVGRGRWFPLNQGGHLVPRTRPVQPLAAPKRRRRRAS